MKWVVTGFLLLFFSVLSLFIGVSDLSIADLFSLTEEEKDVLFVSRIPRLISLLIAGMSMSIAGLIMQQLSQNKFVSPTTAGTMDSARLGILVSMLVFPAATMMQKMLISFLFALAGTFVFMKILDKIKYRDVIFIPLVGLMFGNIVGAATTFLAYRYDLVQSVGTWLHGDFSMLMEGRYELLYLSIPVIIIAYIFAHHFTIAGMGEDFAANLGLSYQKVVYLGLGLVALITASVVLTAGMLPFLGLIVPNIVTIYQGDHLKSSILQTAILGALFVLVCDILGRVIIYPYEISIGLTVGVLGSGIFLYLLLRRRSYGF